jgi:hypothetical protein
MWAPIHVSRVDLVQLPSIQLSTGNDRTDFLLSKVDGGGSRKTLRKYAHKPEKKPVYIYIARYSRIETDSSFLWIQADHCLSIFRPFVD